MTVQLEINKSEPPAGILLALQYLHNKVSVKVTDGDRTELTLSNGVKISTLGSVGRYLARLVPDAGLYGNGELESCQIDHWLDFAATRLTNQLNDALQYLDTKLANVAYLVGHSATLADFAVWESLSESAKFSEMLSQKQAPGHVMRYYNFLSAQDQFKSVSGKLPKTNNGKKSAAKSSAGNQSKEPKVKEPKVKKEDIGKFVDLPGATMGNVVVRFPPEASGYLHIGHAKAALLNQYYQQKFQGKLIMRFDDTNPAKEDAHFEKVILEDVAMLGITYDTYSHTSDHFDSLLTFCEQMIRKQFAYCDDTEAEQMKKERETRTESKHRNDSVANNLKVWEEMKKGSVYGQKCCVRAKIDMNSDNGCMRDPTIYRCKPEPHVRTGMKYKVYPTYDFACPIVDSVEGVTHALRTTEYHDRDDQYFWFLDKLEMRQPFIYEYSRLNLQNTVLSKRKLTWFVDEGVVDGWEDPRFPTVRGVLRRGMTVEGLKQFIVAQGSSRSVVMMGWDKIWSFNKKVIDPVVPRYTALLKEDLVPVYVNGVKADSCTHAQKHPKDASVGMKKVWQTPRILIDAADAKVVKEGEIVTFVNWGNMIVRQIKKKGDSVESINVDLNLENTDFKKTLKLTWLPETEKSRNIPVVCVYFDHIITKGILGKDEDFKQFINRDSRVEYAMIGDEELATLKKGEIIQLQRRGFFICDHAYQPLDAHSCREGPIVLLNIPDGHTKEMLPGMGEKTDTAEKKGDKPKSGSGDAVEINVRITDQGNKIRDLKGRKADKSEIEAAVKVLLELKAEYKSATGSDWKPGVNPPSPKSENPASSVSGNGSDLNAKITDQGNKIRDLKSRKADKGEIDVAVKLLLSLKAQYKTATGSDWKPGANPAPAPPAAHNPAAPSTNQAVELNAKIIEQGSAVRDLKSQKAGRSEIDDAVKVLLALKAQYKAVVGKDWKPGQNPAAVPSPAPVATPAPAPSPAPGNSTLDAKITEQGNQVRNLKSQKAAKPEVDAAVKLLLELKAQYKAETGKDWKPGQNPAPAPNPAPVQNPTLAACPAPGNPSSAGKYLDAKITEQGNQVRILKSQKAAKPEVDAAVKLLLELKAQYKAETGKDWKPGQNPAPAPAPAQSPAQNPGPVGNDDLDAKITEQGNQVRNLKSQKAAKPEVDAAVKLLLDLKAQYKTETGKDWKPGQNPTAAGGATAGSGDNPKKENPKKKDNPKKDKKKEETKEPVDSKTRDVKKVTRLGLEALKEENLSDWYTQVITKAEMIEYYDISGCYILRPWSYAIWDNIKEFFDAEIKKLGVENAYFPMFVSEAALQREKDHIADFAPEVAWVTRSGSTDLAEPIAIRPTSETVMYPSYAKWIKSHRDLPLKLNQWCNIVRWEFKHPQPFLRTREFLWQEGHTAFATQEEASEEVYTILELYSRVYEELLAIPVVRGKKTEKEKFPGGDFTTTTEAYISASGRAIQGATSHGLGQNFSKMFQIVFEDPETGDKKFVYQNSWGLTTRTIGVMCMVHGDNQGLVLPPRVASVQIIIVPCGITASTTDQERKTLEAACTNLEKNLKSQGLRVRSDLRDNYSPGWKFNHWELKGVPIRVELGPRDLKNSTLVAVRRDTGSKLIFPLQDASRKLSDCLDTIQQSMFDKAKGELDAHVTVSHVWNEFCSNLDRKCLNVSPFCGDQECEDQIKKDSARDVVVEEGAPAMGAKSLCIPFKQPNQLATDAKCINPKCSRTPQFYTMFGRSY